MAGSRRNRSVNTRRRENTRGRNTSLSTIQKKKEQEKKVTNNTRNLTANAQRRNNNNQNRTTIGNPRRQTGVQQRVQKKRQDTASRLAQLTKGNLQTIAGSHETTFNAIRNPMEQQYMAAQKNKEQRGENKNTSPYQKGVYQQLLEKERSGMKETREANLEKAAKKIKKGEKNIEKSTEDLGRAGKFAADLYGAGLGMAADALAGPAATASLLSRSFGSAYNRAKEEGADDSQAALYGAAVGGLEAGSEKLFAVATPLRKLYGAGAGDELTEKVLKKLVSKAGSKGAKTALYNGGKVFGSALTEALEEMVVEGLEPAVANQIYAEAVGAPHETSAKDVLHAGLMGGVMGGVLGGAGQIVDHRQGRRVQEVFGENGVLDLAKKAADSDESIGKSLTGAALAEMINNGEAVVAGQANDLYKTVQRQEQKDAQRMQDSMAAADNIIQQSNYVEPSVIDPQTGEELLRRTTANKLEEVKAKAIDMSADMQLPDMTTNQIAESVARIMTGIARPTDVNLFAKSNPAAREVYARMTGKELPDSNEGTRDFLWNQVAQNRIETAEAETLDVADRTKGIIEQRMGDTYEASGQELFAQELAGIDPNDTASLEATVVSFDDFYRAGRRDLPMDEVMAMGNPFHARVPKELREAAYNAGQQDRFRASDTAKGMQLTLGQTAKESRSTGRKKGSKGKLMTDALSEEMRQELPATQMALLRTLARTFNINIHVVDTLAQQEGEASPNGFYVDGEVYLSMTGDRPLPYIFAHEITHHMQVYAPKEYNQLKELVRRRWGDQGGMDAAIDAKRAHYAQNNVSLSYEDALDEIIADSTYEILQDEGFVDELCRSHRNIAQALLDAIKNVISKIRATLAEGELFTPAQNANLLSELDILKDFERIWANGLMRAAENSDAVGTVSKTESVAGDVVYSMTESFESQVEGALNKTLDRNNHVYICETPQILREVGLQPLPMLMTQKHVRDINTPKNPKNRKFHGIDKEVIKKIPYYLEHPVAIMDSLSTASQPGVVVLTEEFDNDGFPIVIALKPDGKGFVDVEMDSNFVLTMFGKEGFYNYWLSNVREKTFLFIDNKKSKALFRKVQLDSLQSSNKKKQQHLLQLLNGFALDTIIRKSNNVVNKTKSTKIYSLPDTDSTGRELSEGQQEYFAESEIRDSNGNLKVMYHGSQESFEAFDKKKAKSSGYYGRGFYFSDSESHAGQYGNLYAVYLNIVNPVKEGTHDITKEQLRAFVEAIAENEDYGIDNYGYDATVDSVTDEIYGKDDFGMLLDINASCVGDMVEAIELFNEVNGTDYDGIIAPTETVAFYPEQVKDVTNENPTSDPRMKFSLKDPVEETKDLIAVHNIFEHKLMSAFKLGGFPMPSIAVTKDNVSHDGFGPISVLFDKSTIDPKASRYNRVYGGDAYTPTFPTVYYEASEKVVDRIRGMVNKHYDMLPDYYQRDVRALRDDTNIEDQLNREGEDGFIEKYLRNYGLKQIYLAETSEIVPVVKKEVRKEMTDAEKELYQKYVDSLGEEAIRESKGAGISGRNWFDKHGEQIKTAFVEFLAEKEGIPVEEGREIADSENPVYWVRQARTAADYLNTGGVKIEETEDTLSTMIAIDEKVNEEDFNVWVKELFDGIVENSGIRNNKDTFTPSGNRRSFKVLHDPVTIDNVVKAMRGEEQQTGGAFLGIGNIEGASSREYKSIEDIKADSDRLYEADMEERKESEDHIRETIEDLGLRYANGKDYFDARNTLVEAVSNNKSRQGIANYLKQYDYIYEYDESIVDELIELRDYIRKLPTKYFEAKPRRAVTFDEIKAVIIPDETGEELIAALDENGIEYVAYDGTETDRLVKINEVAEEKGIKFSLPDEEVVYDYINTHETEFVEVPPVKDYERAARTVQTKSVEELQKQVEILKRDKRLTHGKELDKASIKTEMTELIKVLMSHSEGARGVYDRKLVNVGMENANIIYRAFKDGDMASVTNTAYYAAKEIVENLKFIDDTAFIHYKELRDIMKNTAVTISETDKADIPDYSEFYKSTFGRLKIVNEGGMPVDDLYATLAEAYPDLFDPELTHPADQLMAMADVREALEPYDVMLSAEETEQLIKETAHDLIEVSLRGKPWKSWADRQKEVYDNKLKTMKAMHKEALNDLRIKERMRATRMVDKEKLKAKEYKEKQKDGKARAKANGSIMKNYKWLADRLVKPTDDKHIPDGFRKSLADMLQAFDLQSARSKALEEKYGEPSQKTIKMRELRDRLSEIAKEDDTGVFQYDGYVFDLMNALADKLDGKTISEATTEELASIDTLLKAIVTNIRNYNKAFSDDIKATISELAEKTIEADNERIAKRGKKADRSGIIGGASSMLNESMVSPRDFFEQIGGGVEEAFLSMRKGFDKHVDNLTKTRAFFGEIFPKYNKKTWLRKRTKPGSVIEHWRDTKFQQDIQLESGDTIKLNPAQIMSLYCLMKREQAQGHIFGSGIVASRVDSKSRLWQSLGAKIQPQGSAVMITMTDAKNIISKLTPEQIELADELQAYLNNECAEWGNEVSLKLYGYSKFTEENYFPIKSADQYLDSNFESRQTAERIKNFGFTKGTVTSANNPIMIDDIFRVVADHINKMSLYNAFAAPISDFTRVYNYKSRDDSGVITGSVKASLEDAHGKRALNYINNFMADLNNQTQTRTEGFGRFLNKSLANYKKAMIGGNFRVAFQQPTAVVRAFMLMSPKYFVNAHVNPVKNLRDMKEHCQIARWKSWGHNQVDMARDIDEIMMNNEWTRIDALTMKMYGGLDNLTWSTIWAAIRKETAALHPEVKVNSEEFYAICNDRASEVFDKTQVVDSVFHRSEIMRNKDTMSKMVTSFMAEPTRTFNMVRTEMVKAREEWKDGNKGKAVAHANRTLSVFIINAAMVSAAAAIADAFRDKDPDDDGEDEGFIPTWLENFWANFWGNVNPANMIPVVNDIWGFTEGWGSSNMALDGYDDLVKSAMALADPENRDWRKFAESIATVFGIPLKNSLRELEIIFGAFGIEVFAAEAGEEEEEVKQPLKIKIGSKFDNFLNSIGVDRSEAKKYERSFDKRVKQYERSTKNMTDADKQEYLWGQITANYTTYIKDGNFAAIKDMRAMLEATGGDYEKFDERVLSETKTAMRKSIGTDEATLNACRNFLIDNYEYTEGKISAEILSDSQTATDFQLALCTNDFDSAVDALRTLYDAGMTEADAYTLFMNRSKAIKGKDFSTGEFVSPVDGEISSGFGYRDAPTAGASTYHQAIDIAAPAGSPVAAADGGKVSRAGWNGGYGYSVTIDHGNGKYTIYNHLQEYNVQKGDAVTKGQEIAKVGSTGISTGPHLDFQVRVNGTYVDPAYFL